jgi:hypothetical protein
MVGAVKANIGHLEAAAGMDQTSSWALMIEDVYKRGMPINKIKCLSLPL